MILKAFCILRAEWQTMIDTTKNNKRNNKKGRAELRFQKGAASDISVSKTIFTYKYSIVFFTRSFTTP